MDSRRNSRITEFEHGERTRGSVNSISGHIDLVIVLLLTFLTVGFALRFGQSGGPSLLRIWLGFLFVFVLPGYALTSALFPRKEGGLTQVQSVISVSPIERLVLSVGLSLAVVPLVSIALTLLSVSIGVLSVLLSIGAVTVLGVSIAAVRRYNTPPKTRFSVAVSGSLSRTIRSAIANKTNLVFALLLVMAAGGISVAIVDSGGQESFSELAILGEDDEGELVADAYPDDVTAGDPETVYVEVGNHEHEPVEYTVVVLVEEIDSEGDVTTRNETDRFSVTLDHTERTIHEHDLVVTQTGESLRVSYLLYGDEVPDDPELETTDQSVHFFVDSSEWWE